MTKKDICGLFSYVGANDSQKYLLFFPKDRNITKCMLETLYIGDCFASLFDGLMLVAGFYMLVPTFLFVTN